ncbi:hypothetical protein DHEL01_v210949 [Diaporthe helianthi]|uniref:Uncharacterized protein n=1 Tax=Diaporthe helianthi TaxID=158607 RepID=A0A2P5HK75_DIAHE|nr:hypothetical protein DHEL01_v210949 [Diaporthe helianthi]
MHFPALIAASFLAVVSAENITYPDINLGIFGYPHGNHYVAWSPFTPTTTQDMSDLCTNKGSMRGTATWTTIRVVNTYALDPICRKPFNITDDSTNTTYYDLELACVDDNIDYYSFPQVTAVVERKTNRTVEACAPVPTMADGHGWTGDCQFCCGAGLSWQYACTPETA